MKKHSLSQGEDRTGTGTGQIDKDYRDRVTKIGRKFRWSDEREK